MWLTFRTYTLGLRNTESIVESYIDDRRIVLKIVSNYFDAEIYLEKYLII